LDHLHRSEYREAIKEFTAVTESCPNYPEVYDRLVEAWDGLGKRASNEEELVEADRGHIDNYHKARKLREVQAAREVQQDVEAEAPILIFGLILALVHLPMSIAGFLLWRKKHYPLWFPVVLFFLPLFGPIGSLLGAIMAPSLRKPGSDAPFADSALEARLAQSTGSQREEDGELNADSVQPCPFCGRVNSTRTSVCPRCENRLR
jgi:hypothetical protein